MANLNSVFVIYSADASGRKESTQDFTFLAVEDIRTEVELKDGRIVFNDALSVNGARFVEDGIQIRLDLNLAAALGDEYTYADGRNQHASSSITLTEADVSKGNWTRLMKYAEACMGFEFNGTRLQLGNGAYNFNVLLGIPQSNISFEIVDLGETEVNGEMYKQYSLTEVSISEDAELGISQSTPKKEGTITKRVVPMDVAPAAISAQRVNRILTVPSALK